MGLTVLSQDFFGNLLVLVGEHVMPASYATGGDPP